MSTLAVLFITHLVCQVLCTGIYDEDDGPSLQGRSDDHGTVTWCYEQDHCKQSYPESAWQENECKTGNQQSPIDIISENAKKLAIASTTGPRQLLPLSLPPVSSTRPVSTIDLSGVHQNYAMKEFQMANNGHSIVFNTFVTETGTPSTFKWESKENGVYKLQQVHFHWGADDTMGSEHKIDGKSFPVEMHLVHFRSDEGENGFPTFLDAALSGKRDALAVIGIFLEPSANLTESFLESAVSNFGNVSHKGDKVVVSSTLNLGQNLLNMDEAFHYMGSLTTPGCNEIVAWLVLTNPVKIAPKDLVALRGVVKEGENIPLLNNYRSVQDNKEQVVRLSIK